jgi:DNA-binding MurR/RpiR family transcriptional regulator
LLDKTLILWHNIYRAVWILEVFDLNNLIVMINDRLPKMSKSHKLIGRFIIEHSHRVINLTATKLGEEIGVSESTVVRFANELGFRGYPELQKSLRNHIKVKMTSVQRIDVFDAFMGDDVIRDVLSNDIENLKVSSELLDREQFENATRLICGAKSVYIVGVRSASMLANFLHYYLDLIMENVHLVMTSGAGEVYEQLRRIGKDDVIIGIFCDCGLERRFERPAQRLSEIHAHIGEILYDYCIMTGRRLTNGTEFIFRKIEPRRIIRT